MPAVLTTKTRSIMGPLVPLAVNTLESIRQVPPYDVITTKDAQTYARMSARRETLTSVGHKRPFDEGGPFKVTRYAMERGWTNRSSDLIGPPNGQWWQWQHLLYRGTGIDASSDAVSLFPLAITEDELKVRYDSMILPSSDLTLWGPKAIDHLSPLKSGANMGQFLGELREGLPQIPGNLFRRAKNFNSLGSEYLNIEFGWKPFIGDLQAMYKTWKTLNDRMKQIIRDNAKPVRRRARLFHDVTVDQPVFLGSSSLQVTPAASGEFTDNDRPNEVALAKSTKHVQTSTDIWCVGRTRYYIPADFTDDLWTLEAKAALFGLNPTPALVWQLLPWSWLIDWFSNVGDVISNLSSNGIADLVIDYAYIMRHYKKVTTITTQTMPRAQSPWGQHPWPSTFAPATLVTRVTEETKERVAASPFGFGLQIGDLSGRQLGILGALGLSRQNFI